MAFLNPVLPGLMVFIQRLPEMEKSFIRVLPMEGIV
jgi:hypothetical protein